MNRAPLVARAVTKRALRVVSSTGMRAVGRDVTDSFVRHSTLVVAPHPDDETFGCGAAIARMRALGTPVAVAFVSDGGSSPRPAGMALEAMERLRRAEAARALAVLGVEEPPVFLGFEDGALTGQHAEVAAALEDVLGARRPEQVLVTSSRDRHPDHVAAARAVGAAVARHAGPVRVYEFPIWQRAPVVPVLRSLVAGARAGGDRGGGHLVARPRLVRTDGFLDRKDRAVRVYASQLPHLPVGFVEDFLLPVETFVETSVGAGPAGT